MNLVKREIFLLLRHVRLFARSPFHAIPYRERSAAAMLFLGRYLYDVRKKLWFVIPPTAFLHILQGGPSSWIDRLG